MLIKLGMLQEKYLKILDWDFGTESLDLEFSEIQKEIFDKGSSEKIILPITVFPKWEE